MEEISEAESSYSSTNQLSAGGSRELWEWHRLGEFGQLLFWGGERRKAVVPGQKCLYHQSSSPQGT